MHIRHTELGDIEIVMSLYESARKFMKDSGNPKQWGDNYPSRQVIEDDIVRGISYVCIDEIGESGIIADKGIVATFMFFNGTESTYAYIEQGAWPDDNPYGVVHRITALLGTHGVGTYCLNEAYELSNRHLRIDTHMDNKPMQKLIKKSGFVYCGIVYMKDGSSRIAYIK